MVSKNKSFHSLRIFLIAVLGSTCVVLFLYGCGGSLRPASWRGGSDHALVNNIIGPLNDARAKGRTCGNTYFKPARPVDWNDTLGRVALDHSMDMARTGHLSHKGSDNSGPGERLSKAGYTWASYGENVGQGYRTPEDAVKTWLKNGRHCRNIMDPEFTEAGAAWAKNRNLRNFWTLVLGRPKN
jgi:uncharacterized protein YkwD